MRAATRTRLAALGALALTAGLTAFAPPARASNPLEYPDNGSAAFSRGGAWLAVANEPIAAHYNPAALATQSSGFSLEIGLALPRTCFDRRGPGNSATGPSDPRAPAFTYLPACSSRGGFPNAIPSIAVVYRASARLGIGFAIVPPSTYGTADGQFPVLVPAADLQGNQALLPAPYRYQQLRQQSTILFPTLGVGYAVSSALRVGIGFVSGIGVIDTSTVGVTNVGADDMLGDHMADDSLTTLRAEDRFVPGIIASLHWSVARNLDLATWGRLMDSVRTSRGVVDVTQQPFDGSGRVNPLCQGLPGASGKANFDKCGASQAVPNHFDDALTRFVYPLPPEVRLGVRFHQPRTRAIREPAAPAVRDPLHDDVFDVELDQSLTLNSLADTIEVRFREKDGKGDVLTSPTNVPLPPNADRATGYRDSYGVRLGGQWNAVRDLLGLRAGAWFESRSQDPRLLTVAPVGAARYGVGGGVVVRYHFLDVSVGYQRHFSQGLDNGGNGQFLAPAANTSPPFDLDAEPARVAAVDRRQFRTAHAVNGGSVTFDAHVFTVGGVVRF